MAPLFGSVQLDLPGSVPLPDGRYLARGRGAADEGQESVLVVQTLGAPPSERRRRPRRLAGEAAEAVPALPLTRVTAIRASAPLGGEDEAVRWLDDASEAGDTVAALLGDALALLNQALHANAVASGDAGAEQGISLRRAVRARIGFGSGEETAAGRFRAVREVDPRARGGSRRRRREEELRPQGRLAAILAGRERLDPCETLLLRARADVEAGREREAALQLRIGLEALLAEAAPGGEAHRRDMSALADALPAAEAIAGAALRQELSDAQADEVRQLLGAAERVLRRSRVLGDSGST